MSFTSKNELVMRRLLSTMEVTSCSWKGYPSSSLAQYKILLTRAAIRCTERNFKNVCVSAASDRSQTSDAPRACSTKRRGQHRDTHTEKNQTNKEMNKKHSGIEVGFKPSDGPSKNAMTYLCSLMRRPTRNPPESDDSIKNKHAVLSA